MDALRRSIEDKGGKQKAGKAAPRKAEAKAEAPIRRKKAAKG
jgi:hypothetical protein